MNLLEEIKLKGNPAEIPDCKRKDLPGFFKNLGFKVGVEIGVYLGEFTKLLAMEGFKIYGVDPWLIYSDLGSKHRQGAYDAFYKMAQNALVPYPNVELIRKTSMDAVKDFGDGSLDFVYIDANHKFRYIAEDIYEWSKKVRTGGIVSGHDYSISGMCQVKPVVDAYTTAFDIKQWFVLGKRHQGQEKSWLWFKE